MTATSAVRTSGLPDPTLVRHLGARSAVGKCAGHSMGGGVKFAGLAEIYHRSPAVRRYIRQYTPSFYLWLGSHDELLP